MHTTHHPHDCGRGERLLDMLTYCRRAGAVGEDKFIRQFIMPLQHHHNVTKFWTDQAGNLFFDVCGGSPVLFTAHTDSVHGHTEVRQSVRVEGTTARSMNGSCLGADDAAGCYVLLRLADKGTPCTLAFFREEEVGGLGSSYAAEEHMEWLLTFTHCVSVDRLGTGDVITHQGVGRCCSDEFARWLADSLNASGMRYAPSPDGIFTDSANLTHLIPECTNISCGYQHGHSTRETLDLAHVERLVDALAATNWVLAPVVRDPFETDANEAGFSDAQYLDTGELYYMTKADMADAAYDYPEAFAAAVFALINKPTGDHT